MVKTIIVKNTIKNVINELKQKKSLLRNDGSFFAIVSTEYDCKGNVIFDVFDVINYAIKLGYYYVNTIVYPTLKRQKVAFNDNAMYVIWLVNSKSDYYFDKDVIREKHIWKDVEWGKREKNYNIKGKDPGNVWIPTIDDGKAHITEHILLTDNQIIEKLLAMTGACKDCIIINEENDNSNLHLEEIKRKPTLNNVSSEVFFSTAENMSAVKNKSIKMVVTSPPYWNLKDYFKQGQIGQEDYLTYVLRMKKVWEECYKKMDDEGSLWININTRVNGDKIIIIPKDIIESCKELGFYYKGIIIWHKSSGIPAGPRNIGDHFEYVLVFTKNELSPISYECFTNYSDYKNIQINGGSFWNINRKAGSVGKKYIHPAIYPNGLVERIIEVSTIQGDKVMDPFLGSGTSLIVANNLFRSFVGFEYNENFKELICNRYNNECNQKVNVKYYD